MDKKLVDELIPIAYSALKESEVVNDKNQVENSYKGQIATFGAAIATGSLKAAVCFFSNQGSAEVERPRLIEALSMVFKNRNWIEESGKEKFKEYILSEDENILYKKEKVLNAIIALKLALNLYELVETK